MKLLAIRPDQLAALQWDRQQALREKYIARLRKIAPAQTAKANDEQLHRFCDRGVTRANTHDLNTGDNVYTFIAATLLLGEDFDARPWAKEILDDGQMDEDIKAKMVELRVLMETGVDVARHG